MLRYAVEIQEDVGGDIMTISTGNSLENYQLFYTSINFQDIQVFNAHSKIK